MHLLKPKFVIKTVSPFLLMIGSLTTPTMAYANWFEQGAELFKSIQESTNNKDTKALSTEYLSKNLTSEDIQKAFKEALNKGTETVVNQLSQKNGFNNDANIRIPLPKSLKTVKETLDRFGMGEVMDNLETKLNRAAEDATPQAKALFVNAIKELSFEDVQKIYNGPQDSATQYLKTKTSPELRKKIQPIIDQSLQQVGALKAYDKAISKYKDLPFVPDIKADLESHVMQESLDGIFYYIAKEEAAIRKDPVKQSTELLKKVFGK